MNPARFSTRNPIVVNLAAVLVVATGVVTLAGMSRESYPSVATGWARITTVFPGASPDEVERLVTVPVEDAVAELEGVDRIVSFSSEELSYVGVELEPGLDDPAATIRRLADEVSALRDLPPEAESPEVREEIVRLPTLMVAIRGDVADSVLQAAGRHLSRRLLRIDGLVDVEAAGLADRQLRVEVDPPRLRSAGLSLEQVARAVVERAGNLAAGHTDDGERQRLVRGVVQPDEPADMADIVVSPRPDGGSILLRHVADVADVYDESGVTARVDGERAIVLKLYRRAGADAGTVNEAIESLVAAERAALPTGVTVTTFADASYEVLRTTETLYENALYGLVLVLLTLGLFMGWRNAAIVALGVPVALAGGFVLMHFLGITLNMLSLGALILCIGLVVDDAIVIVENFHRHVEGGASRARAAIAGTAEVMWPVISATATTCAAFLPLLLMTGVLGEFFAIIPKVVVVVLLASLVEALIVLPSHMRDFGGVPDRPPGTLGRLLRGLGATVLVRYRSWLRVALRARGLVVLGAYIACSGLLVAAWVTKDVVLLAADDVDGFDVRVRMPADSSIQATGEVLEEVERRLAAMRTGDVEAIWTTRGQSRDELRTVEEDYVGMASVALVRLERRSSTHAGRDLLERASGAFDDLVGPEAIEVVEHEFGPPVGAPVSVRIAGDDAERLSALGRAIGEELSAIPGVREVTNSAAGEKRELRVEVDEGAVGLHGLTTAAVGNWLRLAFSDAPVATMLHRNERLDVILGLDGDAHGAAEVGELTLRTVDGRDVPLEDVATVREERRPTHIRRNDRRRGVRVTAHVDRTTTSQAANRAAAARIRPIAEANPDVSISLAGEYEETNESVRSLALAFALAIALIYGILAAQFRSLVQPVVIVAAIPLSLVGVVLGFFASGAPIGLIALVGVVGLAGIVVNDALVLIDFINRLRAEGRPLDEAIVEASALRLRPILATTVTTVAGILPLALAGDGAPLLSPMATALAWGLSAATLLTIFVVPCLYRMSCTATESLERWGGPVWRRIRGGGD